MIIAFVSKLVRFIKCQFILPDRPIIILNVSSFFQTEPSSPSLKSHEGLTNIWVLRSWSRTLSRYQPLKLR